MTSSSSVLSADELAKLGSFKATGTPDNIEVSAPIISSASAAVAGTGTPSDDEEDDTPRYSVDGETTTPRTSSLDNIFPIEKLANGANQAKRCAWNCDFYSTLVTVVHYYSGCYL
jgi:hypothetical protein